MSGFDYNLMNSPGLLAFLTGSSDGEIQCIVINIVDDIEMEEDESFSVMLFPIGPNFIVEGSGTSTITITDDDLEGTDQVVEQLGMGRGGGGRKRVFGVN